MKTAIVGGGAAGFFLAINLKEMCPEMEVTILERGQRVLRKVAVSGGGRCNCTNTFRDDSGQRLEALQTVYPRGHRLMKRLFKQFSPKDAYQWFESHGVALTVQPDGCVFPRSQNSQTIIDMFLSEARRLGVVIRTNTPVNAMEELLLSDSDDGELQLRCSDAGKRQLLLSDAGKRQLLISDAGKRLLLLGDGGELSCYDYVAITTGGLKQGAASLFPPSNCLEGQEMASVGADASQRRKRAIPTLEVSAPVPSLFTFSINDERLTSLMGTVVEDVEVMIPGTKLRASGPLLITHWGMSGPSILRLSSYAARELSEHDYKMPLAVNWVNGVSEEQVRQCLLDIMARHPQKLLSSVSPVWADGQTKETGGLPRETAPTNGRTRGTAPTSGLPSRLWNYLLEKHLGGRAHAPWGSLNQKELNRLVNGLVNDQYQIVGRAPFKDEFVTCGGIDLASVNPATLESKTCPGLFFAGEVLDIDGITGGFNFQAAWTTAYVVSKAIANDFSNRKG